jgi:hypothetical protein
MKSNMKPMKPKCARCISTPAEAQAEIEAARIAFDQAKYRLSRAYGIAQRIQARAEKQLETKEI